MPHHIHAAMERTPTSIILLKLPDIADVFENTRRWRLTGALKCSDPATFRDMRLGVTGKRI
jgi:hypothetical protein